MPDLSDSGPDFTPAEITFDSIPVFSYAGNLRTELDAGTLDTLTASAMLEDMLMIREFEEMIVRLRAGAYEPLAEFNYRGPTHVSIGQEAVSVGACSALCEGDRITSTHRGHGDSIARGTVAIRAIPTDKLRDRVPGADSDDRNALVEAALEEHVFRTIAELFGKEDGYCRGRGGGMHIADFSVGHLGANAIVGGGVPIATGAALALRYLRSNNIVCCFAGDGAYANGVVLESLNFAAQYQFVNRLAGDRKFGLPIIFLVVNNHYGMTGRADDEVTGIKHLARRAAGFSDNNLHAETVNGMDVLAVRDAVRRAVEGCRNGDGPYLVEAVTYRYYGHSLSDPRNEYRTRREEAAWKALDPIETFNRQLLAAGACSDMSVAEIETRVKERNSRAAVRAAASSDPAPADVLDFLYTTSRRDEPPKQFQNIKLENEPPEIKRTPQGELTYRDAIKEALMEEMQRDGRVFLYGEDVADYGNAFKVTKGLLETFGRRRVFNAPISEACICGTAVGAAMMGLRPIAELMYMDFSLMASDQIANQAAKWHYMSGGQATVPLVYRVSVGGGKGYGGQHSQSFESLFAHIPGLYIAYPATPYDAKGMLKSAIRDDNPVMFVESQLLYGTKGMVPEEEYFVPLGQADIKRSGEDVTIACWGPAVMDSLKAAETLAETGGPSVEVVDIRSLVPLDIDTVLASVQKTGRCVVAAQAVNLGSFTAEIAARIQAEVFDYLDAPILRVGAVPGIAPQSHVLESAFLPDAADIADACRTAAAGTKKFY